MEESSGGAGSSGDLPNWRIPGDSDSDDDDKVPSQEEAGEMLCDYLLEAHISGRLTAKDVCLLSFWAKHAGAKGVDDLAKAPNTQSGNFKRHLDGIIASSSGAQKQYQIDVPVYSKTIGERTIRQIPACPPHEWLSETFVREDLGPKLQEAMQKEALPPNYHNHPVVVKAKAEGDMEQPIIPMAVFIDGVPYCKHDSLILFVVQSLLTDTQYLTVCLRKRFLCRCGCRGWCSLHVIWSWLRWSFECLASGLFPAARHTNEPFGAGDETRSHMSGQKMACKGVLVQLRADWSELVSRLGFFPWSHTHQPCCLCTASRAELYEHMEDPNWIAKDSLDYDSACSACEVFSGLLSKKNWKYVANRLEIDVRSKGKQGLCLTEDIPALGLVKGDRVEPSQTMEDAHAILHRNTPVRIVFWRTSAETITKHRNCFFSKALGTDVQSSLAIDAMHTLALGVFAQFVVYCLWTLLDCNLTKHKANDKETRDAANLRAIRVQLFQFYKQFEQSGSIHSITRVVDIQLTTLGSRQSPILHLKAAETVGVLRFLDHYLPSVSGTLSPLWGQAATSLRVFWDKMQESPMIVSEALQKDCAPSQPQIPEKYTPSTPPGAHSRLVCLRFGL